MNAQPFATTDRIALCRECDWVMRMPPRAEGEAAHCPRCHHHVAGAAQRDMQRPLAWSLAALIMLALVFAFDFLSFSTQGIGHTMSFVDAAGALAGYDYPSLAALLMFTTVGLPGLYLLTLAYLCAIARKGPGNPFAIHLARRLRPLEPWMMSDVFIVGVLVSLIKIVTLADIRIGPSFIAFCIYAALLLRTLTLVDWISLWDRLAPLPARASTTIETGRTGASQQLVICRGCETPFHVSRRHDCPRCGRRHPHYGFDRIQLTWALLATATILYIPANIYPIMSTTSLGSTDPQTIIGGVLHLVHTGSWPIALVIFVASVVVPISKIVALGWLCLAASYGWHDDSPTQMRLYRLTEKVGRWSMIDVFVVAVLAALVRAGSLMAIEPGPAALSFAAVVVMTMVAALTFDTRRLWGDTFNADSA
ncbi:PqiA family integral membrane protein [Salinisphaera dokdonensis CL-ES53]|uniref:PqiA family integral membrane protein n=1 Tax=Salinisphaera dokdonensis CL-ES53 TaxID=1304272 RepID=A0ABV2B1G0_9GAMM